MQRFATQFVDVCLNIIGIPHYTEGTVIELTNGRFEIAEACAGLRFLIATVTLGVLFAYLMYQRIYKIVLFLFASIAIPLVGNGLRCLGIILLAHFTSNKFGAGADHIIYGWIFNVAILLAVIVVGSMFRDEPGKSLSASAKVVETTRSERSLPVVLTALLAACLISAGPAWASWGDRQTAQLDRSALETSLRSGGWRGNSADGNWRPYFPRADIHLQEERDIGIEPINLFIGYYARPRAGETVTAQPNRPWDDKLWIVSGAGDVRTKLAGSTIVLNEYTISSETGKRLVWATYWADGVITNNPLLVRLLAAKAVLIGQEGQAIIAVSTPLDDSIDVVRARLSTSLSYLGSISSALHRVKPSVVQRAS
jgi:EpsI family protein